MSQENRTHFNTIGADTKLSEFNYALKMLEFTDFETASDHLISIFEKYPVPIWVYDINGIVIFWNKAAEKLFGYKSLIIGSPDPLSLYLNTPKEDPISFERQLISKNGKYYTLQIFALKKENGNGFFTWYCGYDISKYKLFENVVNTKLNQLGNLEKILHQSDSFVYIRENNINWSLKYCTSNFYNFFGKPENYSDNNPISYVQYIYPEDIARIKAELLIAEHNKWDNMRLEYRIINKSKRVIWISDSLEMIRNKQGNVIQYQGVITDINFNKKAEIKIKSQHKIIQNQNIELTLTNEKLKKSYLDITLAHEKLTQSEIALRESEELYRQLVQTSPDAIAFVDLKGNILYASPKSRPLFGYPNEEPIEGKNIFQFIDITDLEKAKEAFTQVINNQTTSTGTFIMIKKDNTRFFAEVSSTIIKDFQGKTKGMISILRDVTDRKQVEEELIKAKNKAEESDRLKSAFLANMSHEIRTPMNGIIGFSSLLNEDNLSSQTRAEYVDIIKTNGNILLKLIDDILDIAKIEAGQLKVYEKPCYLNQLLYDEYLLYSKLIDQKTKNIKLQLALPPVNLEIPVVLDSDRLIQIISNLLGNAMKFTENGYIEFGYIQESPSWLKFFVKDTGIGMPKEKHEIIFDRFRQVDESTSRKYGGTGLGLTISSNLIKLMGGKMWVESEVNVGSTFYFTIPHKTIKTEKIPGNVNSFNQNQEKSYKWNNKKILIAEDENVNFFFIKEILKNTNSELIHVVDGLEALEICKSDPQIDLILMDIKMPIMNGLLATKEIKKIRGELPIIAQTAYAMEEEKNQCIQAGCDAFLPKPIDRLQLLSILDDYLSPKNSYK